MLEDRRCPKCQTLFKVATKSDRELCDYHLRLLKPAAGVYSAKYQADYAKWIARKRVEKAVEYGKLAKPKSCSYCRQDSRVIHAHHVDYERPLDVVWLCQRCHQLHHDLLRKELPSPIVPVDI